MFCGRASYPLYDEIHDQSANQSRILDAETANCPHGIVAQSYLFSDQKHQYGSTQPHSAKRLYASIESPHFSV